jgi:homoserine dehydrogenase
MTWDAQTDEPAKRPQGRAFTENRVAPCKVALLGFGTVGQSVAELLCLQSHSHLRLTHIFNRQVKRKQASWVPSYVRWTEDIDEVLSSDVDVVIEVVGGVDPAASWVRRALESGKSVVTANKHLIAKHGTELLEVARQHGQKLEFGASVAGGVPVLCGLEHGLSGERLFRLAGVLNGTCNYILSNMESRGLSFADALAKAQELGYAEADPSDDVHGVDAACKLAILARVGFGADVHPDQVYQRTIEGVESIDFRYAKKLGATIRQTSLAEVRGNDLLAAVQPAVVPHSSPLAHAKDNQNALLATGVHGGETLFAGRGAGGGPTSVAVVSDVVSISRKRVPPATHDTSPLKAYSVSHNFEFPYYLRLTLRKVGDSAGVTRVLSKHGIEVRSVLQRPRGAKAKSPLVLLIEPCRALELEAALQEMAKQGVLTQDPLSLPLLS